MDVSFQLNDEQHAQALERAKALGFDSVGGFAAHLVKEDLKKQAKSDEDKIAKKLEQLGYL